MWYAWFGDGVNVRWDWHFSPLLGIFAWFVLGRSNPYLNYGNGVMVEINVFEILGRVLA